ncbi:hypothetical protein LI064_02350 [Clostridium perfringens]|uniref:hypothetical protein n=1 Tax=Clostridium perfringens TaxID=1502 RepID=UPI00224783F4|nr:hypothetical protein [Clostridium perfringens]MCX0353363.1 hypothetical protein [Clostridium perfringens]
MARNKRWKRRAKRFLGRGLRVGAPNRIIKCTWCRKCPKCIWCTGFKLAGIRQLEKEFKNCVTDR